MQMKTNRISALARLSGLAIALALFASAGGEAKAQDTGTAKGGATKLLQPNGSLVTPKVAPDTSQPMSCPKCQDKVFKTKDYSARGANKPYVTFVRHLCDGCSDTITVTGHGKAKQDVVTHKCTSCGAEDSACCNTKKGSNAATKGMEKAKSLEVAPIK